MSDQDLQFKPLSEGLGFHPFSNGLPYTPSWPSHGGGAGAVAAGRPQFVFPKPAAAIAAPAIAAPVLAPAQAVAPSTVPAPTAERAFGWDYVGRRFFAYLLDSGFNILLGALVLIASLWPSYDSFREIGEAFASSDLLLLTTGFLLFFSWALVAAQEVAIGTTIGKKLFGLRLEGGALALLVRALVFVPSALFFGLGLFGCLLGSGRRGLHDWATGIQPREN